MVFPKQECWAFPQVLTGVLGNAEHHSFTEQPTSPISLAVLPFAPRYVRARADDILQGEKKMFLSLLVSFSFLKRSTVNLPTASETCSIATIWKEATDGILLFECLK